MSLKMIIKAKNVTPKCKDDDVYQLFDLIVDTQRITFAMKYVIKYAIKMNMKMIDY